MKKKKLIIPVAIAIIIVAAIAVVLLLPKHKVDYAISEKNISQDTMEEKIGSKPDSVTEKDGMTINTYDYSIYMDYTGKMDYYYLQDKFMMSRWETECDGASDMNEVYQSISANVTKEMGNGKADKKQKYTTWTGETKDVTVGCNETVDGEYTVYMVENQHQTSTNEETNDTEKTNDDTKANDKENTNDDTKVNDKEKTNDENKKKS